MYKRLTIPAELKDQFTEEIKKRKGVHGGVVMDSTIEAIKLWLEYPELLNGDMNVKRAK